MWMRRDVLPERLLEDIAREPLLVYVMRKRGLMRVRHGLWVATR